MNDLCARCDAPSPSAPPPESWARTVSSAGRDYWLCGPCGTAKTGRSTTASTGDHAADQLRLFIERLERLHEEKREISNDIRDVMSEAKGQGYHTKIISEIIKRRRMDGHDLREFTAILETYEAALGMAFE